MDGYPTPDETDSPPSLSMLLIWPNGVVYRLCDIILFIINRHNYDYNF